MGAKAEALPEVCGGTSGESEVTDVAKRYPSRKDLENALIGSRESEARLRRIIDTIPSLAWCNLPDGSNEFLNQRWHDYTGLSAEEAHGWGWKAAIHPVDLPMLMQKWEALRDADKPGECEVRLRRFDGAFRSFLCRVEPLRYEGREPVRWYGTATDIEDHKREENLAAGEKLLLEMVTSGHSIAGNTRGALPVCRKRDQRVSLQRCVG
jgi:PAS domain S-box-containing protein